MKLVIQIPCFNEAGTIKQTLSDLPRHILGISQIEYLIIDDGCTDDTVSVAKQSGAHHILSMGANVGLAKAFMAGIRYAVEKQGADIVVNTDGDNQYCGKDIVKLIEPILDYKADVVIGCRPIREHVEFSPLKKRLQLIGSWFLRRLTGFSVRDAPSGFRAYTREACLKINLYSKFSHCIETLIQISSLGLRVGSVNIDVNRKTRESRLFKSIPHYIYEQSKTILSMYVLYKPGVFFFSLSILLFFISSFLGIRFFWLIYIKHSMVMGRTHLPSLITFSISILASVILFSLGIMAGLIKMHRKISEETQYLARCLLIGDGQCSQVAGQRKECKEVV